MNNFCHVGGTGMHLGANFQKSRWVANENVHVFDDGGVFGQTLRVLIIRTRVGWSLPWEEGEEKKCFDEFGTMVCRGSLIRRY